MSVRLKENVNREFLLPRRAVTALAFIAIGFGVLDFYARISLQRHTPPLELLLLLCAFSLWIMVDTGSKARRRILARPRIIDAAPLDGLDTFIWTMIYVGLLFLSGILAHTAQYLFFGPVASTLNKDRLLLMKLCGLCFTGIGFVVLFVQFCGHRGIDVGRAIRLRFSRDDVILTITLLLMCMPLAGAAAGLSHAIRQWRGLPPPSQELVTDIIRSGNPITVAFAVVAVVGIGPVLEEIVFRGLIFRFMRDRLGFIIAMILSSLLFAGFHGELYFFLQQALLGVVLCIAYERTQSLTTPIIIHCLNNLAAIVVNYL